MGKGDKKTRRGKITNGSYGKTRPKKSSAAVTVTEKSAKAEPVAEKPKAAAKPKTTKPKAEKAEAADTKPKTIRKKKTEE